ncbi:MAG: choice-of-anchor I family protein [Flavobacteriia bacterium]|nr:choice-of-anchor I family protein [Flavobacteriia bacterium]
MNSKLLITSISVLLSTIVAHSQIALWNYNTIVGSPTTYNADLGVGTSSIVGTLTVAAAATGMDPIINNGCGAQNGVNPGAWAFTAVPGLTNESNGVQYNVSTVGYQNIKFTWDQRWSGTSVNTVRVKYTTDGLAWTDFVMTDQNTTYCNGVLDGGRFQNNGVGDQYRRISVDFVSILAANNNPNFAVRVLAAHYQASGEFRQTSVATNIATGGTWRFDNVKVDGGANTSIAAANNFIQVAENVGTVNVPILIANANASPVTLNLGFSVYSNATDNVDFTWTNTLTIPANTNGTTNHVITIVDDLLPEKAERIVVKILSGTNTRISTTENYQIIFIKDNDYQAPSPSNALNLTLLTSFSNGTAGTNSAEIVAFDEDVDRLYIANSIGAKLDIVNFSNPASPVLISSISTTPYGNINSVVAHDSIVALAIENSNPQLNGSVVFLDYNGTFLSQVTVGAMPDMITFNKNYTKILTANEGEPNATYTVDPEGSVSIIDLTPGIANLTNANVTTIGLTAYNGQQVALVAQGIRVFSTSASVAQDLEPEYITISDDNTKAYVGIQEANALLTIDLTNNTVISLTALGYSSYGNASNNALDASDQSGAVLITGDLPIKGAYMPDALSFGTIGGQGYIFTANEGDSREFGTVIDANRINSATFTNLDPVAFPDASILKNSKFLGRLSALKYSGDTDGDGDYDELHVMSGRSFSIRNATTGALVYDSKDLIEQIIANHPTFAAIFNASNSSGVPSLKNRSDDKGPEVEGIYFQTLNGKPYVFLALERIGGVMVFNVENPLSPVYVAYRNNRSTTLSGPDLGAEGIVTIPAAISPNGNDIVILANEVSSTLSIYQVNTCATAAGAVVTAAANAICVGASTTLSIPGSIGSSYQWLLNGQPIVGEISTQLSAAQAGSYSVTVNSLPLACSDTSLVKVITILPSPIVTANINQSVCAGSPTTLNGGGALTYSWNNGVTNGVAFIPASTATYTVTGTNLQGCTGTATTTVTVNSLPIVSAGLDQTVCGGSSVTFGATGATNYVWNNGATGASLTVQTGTSPSSTTYSVSGTNIATGCTSNDQVVVNVLGLPAVLAGNDQTVCSGDTVVLIGSGATSYSWNNGAVNNSGFVAQATQTYTLTGIDINLCQNTDQITINVNPTPTVSAGIDTSICAGSSFILTGIGASSYSWNNGVINGVSFIPNSTATYTLTGTNAFGCDDQDQISITVNSLPTINVGPNATICEGDSIVLQATGALSYSWNNGQANGAVIYPTQPSSSYSVIGVDANNCQDSETLLVSVNPLPVVSTISDTLVCDYNVPVQLNVLGNASSFTWSNGTVGYSISISQAGTYTVTGELNGCTDSSSIVVVLDACLGIYEEDLFALSYYPNPTQKEVYVSFNRPISATISILTMDGRVLFIDQLINQSETILDFSSIATGSYLIKLDQNGDTNLIKVIKE